MPRCPGCGIAVSDTAVPLGSRYNAAAECLNLYHELSANQLANRDSGFSHQIAVDCFGGQHAGGCSKPITTVFSLVGLSLFLEYGKDGHGVQKAHMVLAKRKVSWPVLAAPAIHYATNVGHVMTGADATTRARIMRDWAQCTWQAWRVHHEWIRGIISERGLAV